MPRRKPPRRTPPPAGIGDALRRAESGPDGVETYIVRTVPGSHSTKVYRCPGCDQEIAPGVAHVVAWPAEDTGGVADRRHWHTGCWGGRHTRGLARRWS